MIRKWIYKFRYILIIWSALLGLLGASWTFGYNVIEDCYTNAWISPYTVRCVEFDPWESITYDWLLNSVDNLLNFKFDDLYNFFYTSWYSYNISNSIFWNNSWKLNLMHQWNYWGMKLYEYSWLCYSSSSDPSVFWVECSSVSRPCVSTVNTSIEDFYTYWASHNINKVYYLPATRCINWGCSSKFNGDSLCLVYDDWTYCFTMASTVGCSAWNNIFSAITEIENKCTTNWNCLEELTNLWYVWESPFVWGGWGWSSSVVPAPSTYYYEYLKNRYWRVENDCKVWTNLTAMWWDSVNFDYWSWADIFELYDSLYWTWSWTDYIVKVWTWINWRLLNYNYWFNWSNNCYQYYSWGQIYSDCSYTNFPFAWQKTAIYFMTDLLNSKGVNSDWNLGYEFAVFCDYALHWENASPIKEGSALLSNINNYYNYEQLLLWDGPRMDFEKFFGTGDWYNDWEEENYDLNLDKLMDKFTSFTDMFTDYFIRPFNWEPILPRYIIVALILILLFRLFLK